MATLHSAINDLILLVQQKDSFESPRMGTALPLSTRRSKPIPESNATLGLDQLIWECQVLLASLKWRLNTNDNGKRMRTNHHNEALLAKNSEK